MQYLWIRLAWCPIGDKRDRLGLSKIVSTCSLPFIPVVSVCDWLNLSDLLGQVICRTRLMQIIRAGQSNYPVYFFNAFISVLSWIKLEYICQSASLGNPRGWEQLTHQSSSSSSSKSKSKSKKKNLILFFVVMSLALFNSFPFPFPFPCIGCRRRAESESNSFTHPAAFTFSLFILYTPFALWAIPLPREGVLTSSQGKESLAPLS